MNQTFRFCLAKNFESRVFARWTLILIVINPTYEHKHNKSNSLKIRWCEYQFARVSLFSKILAKKCENGNFLMQN